MQRKWLLIGLLSGLMLAWGCGGEAAQGEACDEEGAEEGVCEAGSICGKQDDTGDIECLKVCTDDAQCASNEACNGVTGSNVKGCRRKP